MISQNSHIKSVYNIDLSNKQNLEKHGSLTTKQLRDEF